MSDCSLGLMTKKQKVPHESVLIFQKVPYKNVINFAISLFFQSFAARIQYMERFIMYDPLHYG